ncbi:TPA: SDR family oxidoreductase [Streptococcus pyogenes]|nr:SDR family oxidoreductase [Streptococcus pyogenes]
MQRKLWNGENNVPKEILEGDINSYRLGIPLKKIAEPEDVAESIFYLASDKANHITMEDLTIDGGATMGV